MQKQLLLSNSTLPGTPFFTWPRPWIKSFLGEKPLNLVFVPFAAVTFSFDEYEDIVRKAFNEMGYSIFSLHKVSSKEKAIDEADGIVVGGGNTFALLNRLYEYGLLEVIRAKVVTGTPYVGWSAGANLACPTIMTTNDMPIVHPPSFRALDLVPFQINPHYHELKFANQGGETRVDRLNEFLKMNPAKKVIGLPEGMLISREGDGCAVKGTGVAKFYSGESEIAELPAGADISDLLKPKI